MTDQMKKAEELAKSYAKKIWQGGTRPYKNAKALSYDDYLAGYTAALQTKTDKVQGLLKEIDEIHSLTAFPQKIEWANIINRVFVHADRALKAYQTDEGEG